MQSFLKGDVNRGRQRALLHQPYIEQQPILLVGSEALGELFERRAGVAMLQYLFDPGKDGLLGRAIDLHLRSLRGKG
jgi:hypothetical protein